MDGFIGEVRLFAIPFVPVGWLACDGSVYLVQQYPALYAIIGNLYGGQASKSFAVPNLQGTTVPGVSLQAPSGTPFSLASHGGAATVVLTPSQQPPHAHTLTGAKVAVANRVATASGNYLADPAATGDSADAFVNTATAGTLVPLASDTLTPFPGTGGGHENRQPYLALRYCICALGEYPIRP